MHTTERTRPVEPGRPDADAARRARLTAIAGSALRLSLGLLLLWFGALKVAGVSSVSELVASTGAFVPLLSDEAFVRLVGAGELLLGLWLVAVRPDLVIHASNPFLLTVLGQFVVNNLVLVLAAAALATLPTRPATRAAPP